MATLRIVEYEALATDANGNAMPIPLEPSIAHQSVSFTTSTQSAALNTRTKFVRLEASADAYVLFGTNPTATATCGRIPSGVVEHRGVASVQGMKIAVYDGSS